MVFAWNRSSIAFRLIIIWTILQEFQALHATNKIEEYFVEHEISTVEARNSANGIDLKTLVAPPGCQECTKEEKLYCLSTNLINDHCCCDKRHEEVFPFIPHTCFRGARLCNIVLDDCAQYNRLRECCCDKLTKEYWKKNLNSSTDKIESLPLLLLLIVTVFMYLN